MEEFLLALSDALLYTLDLSFFSQVLFHRSSFRGFRYGATSSYMDFLNAHPFQNFFPWCEVFISELITLFPPQSTAQPPYFLNDSHENHCFSLSPVMFVNLRVQHLIYLAHWSCTSSTLDLLSVISKMDVVWSLQYMSGPRLNSSWPPQA